MAVIVFARKYPSYHSRKGELTNFPALILEWYYKNNSEGVSNMPVVKEMIEHLNGYNIDADVLDLFGKELKFNTQSVKYHTIRKGNRWKEGMFFSPRCWSVEAYRSKQIILTPPIQIKKVYDFKISNGDFFIDGKKLGSLQAIDLAINDGLKYKDFLSWFKYPKDFAGQIICWGENINY